MDKLPGASDRSDATSRRQLRGEERTLRGQSDVVAIVLLFGMIAIGAAAVIVTGGLLIDSAQGTSQHELAKDNAIQTHQSISEALQSGEARQLAVSDQVEMDVQQSGSITIEMGDGSGGVCSDDVSDVDPVHADMGAIVYDTPEGAVVYQGGAIWEEMDGGLSIERAPPISYDNETARISIQTVTAEADSFEGQMAKPNESMQTAMAEETNRMLTECPANGYTDLQINVTSPNYAELWRDHFDDQVDTGPDVNVTGPDTTNTVSATISNATSAHESRGLRFANVSGPTVVGPNGDGPNPQEFNVSAALANDDFTAREATVKLEIAGANETPTTVDVPTTGNVTPALPGLPLERQDDLIDDLGLTPNKAHDYTLYLVDSEDDVVEQTTGRFFLEDSGGGNVTFFDDTHELTDEEDTLVVNATLINTFTTNASGQTVEFQIVDDEVDMPDSEGEPITVPAYGGTKGISYVIDVSQLRAGTYDYELRHDGVTLERNFTIHDPLENSGSIVGDVRVEAIDPASDAIEKGEDFEVSVQLYNTAANETTTEVSLDLLDGDLSGTTGEVTIDGATRTNVTVELDGSEIADELATRTEHEYEVTVDNAGETESFPGSFLVLESEESLQIDDHGTEKDGDWRWINATLANHGNATGDDTATLTIYDNETESEVGSVDTDEPIELGAANQTTLPFGFDAANLSGAYDYEVSYGGETVEGYFSEGEADTGDGNVSITAPGEGSVTVLGTEVSAYSSGDCEHDYDWYWDDGEWERNWYWDCDPAQKSWAPVSVSAILDIDGTETEHRFDNEYADPDNYYNETNLNTFDSQNATYSYNWTQVEGQSATLTVSSILWEASTYGYEQVNERDDGVPSTPPVEDYQPDEDILYDPYTVIDANSGTNSEAVRVLTDGDEVPNPQTSGEDQRSAAEILNQGAADRIDEDGNLDLGPYEAVFLFELTQSSYDGMWEDADDSDGDPDYNDVIAVVSFNPDNPDDVTLNAGDHSVSFGPDTTDPDETNDSGQQNISFGGGTEGPGTGSQPSSPEPQSPDPGDPSGPDEIDVEVGGIVIG